MSDENVLHNDDENACALSAEVKYPRESEDDDSARTITQFCRRKHISLSSYFKLRRLGRGPREDRVPFTRIVRISREAEREWDAQMRQLAREEAAVLEVERRRALAAAAGKLSGVARQGAPKRQKTSAPSRVARPRKR